MTEIEIYEKIKKVLVELEDDTETGIIGSHYYTYNGSEGSIFHNIMFHLECADSGRNDIIPKIKKVIKEVTPNADITLLKDGNVILCLVAFI